MKITCIEKAKGGKYRIWLNDSPAFLLYPSEMRALKVVEGEELGEDQERRIRDEILPKRAVSRCMHILGRQDKTEKQIIDKLRGEEYPEETAIQAAERMKELRFLDDLRYCSMYIEGRKLTKSAGEMTRDLLAKGVSEDVIRQALEEADMPGNGELIRRWAEKKRFDAETASEDEKRKFFQFLMRKGFNYGDIKRALT
ncbi:MAG: recombination regulator RecX [Lachnospiraceae bacterium]|nr:recombination regulator RecX [Lachnospiraceae bacterium]